MSITITLEEAPQLTRNILHLKNNAQYLVSSICESSLYSDEIKEEAKKWLEEYMTLPQEEQPFALCFLLCELIRLAPVCDERLDIEELVEEILGQDAEKLIEEYENLSDEKELLSFQRDEISDLFQEVIQAALVKAQEVNQRSEEKFELLRKRLIVISENRQSVTIEVHQMVVKLIEQVNEVMTSLSEYAVEEVGATEQMDNQVCGLLKIKEALERL